MSEAMSAEGSTCPVCTQDLLDGRHEVRLLTLWTIPLKVLLCPLVPSGVCWLTTATRPLYRGCLPDSCRATDQLKKVFPLAPDV